MKEHDACALVAVVRADGRAVPSVAAKALAGLAALSHRSGAVAGEADGAGLLVDLPRALWQHEISSAGGRDFPASELAVGHFFVPQGADAERELVRALVERSATVVHERIDAVRTGVLGPLATAEEPRFWQIAIRIDGPGADAALFDTAVEIERSTSVSVASLSRHSAVYKLRGSATQLDAYFDDLTHPLFATSVAFGHNRYSTNTRTTYARVQPFARLAHNGEINTIARLRDEAVMLGLPVTRDGSDSQDLDAVFGGLVHHYGLHPIEALEMLQPPIVNETLREDAELADLHVHARAALGPFAQGPAALLLREADTLLFSVDAMGLRPLWHVRTADEHIVASERTFVPLREVVADPRPLAPGEKLVLERTPAGWETIDGDALRERFRTLRRARRLRAAGERRHLTTRGPRAALRPRRGEPRTRVTPGRWEGAPPDEIEDPAERREHEFAVAGFEPDHLVMAQAMMRTGNEPISSLGYDGPLAALASSRRNVSDHLQESVAVVTNPAMDREREIEHFSTRTLVGRRPAIAVREESRARRIELRHPILLGGHAPATGRRGSDERGVARALGTWTLDDLVAAFGSSHHGRVHVAEAWREWTEHPRDAVLRIAGRACAAVRGGASVVVVADRDLGEEGRSWLDPHLVLAAVHRALVAAHGDRGSLRRDASLVLSCASLRDLHDIVVALGLGADAVNPYLLIEIAASDPDPDALPNLVEALRKGIEKVLSTLGIHELRGYGPLFSAIGVRPEIARVLGVPSVCATDEAGLGWDELARDGDERGAQFRGRTPARLAPPFRLYPRIWKAALGVAKGELPYSAYAEKLETFEREHPVSLRHLLDIRASEEWDGEPADTGASRGHSAPVFISSMSFGSQGETAYRAYAEAAHRLDIVCINGEGGELPDLVGRYPRTRGQQIASGRFGVSAVLANASDLLEIKIGQGAKPGEGGHLPGRKVSAKVALARNARPGVDLISPSNNHDIYSIEDLAQVVHELHVVNPNARVAVKVPVVPEIGIIAVGIAKSGADIVTVSGFDGGTGAARQHALRRVGMPVEYGVAEAHRALVAAGLRDSVELWCDGGLKSAADVVKMLCLGADRAGFATLAMVAIGCTICRGCQLDTCHVGITTQIETRDEAAERGLKRFEPQELERATLQLCRMFGALREEIGVIAARAGVRSTRELVGRTDLLVQARGHDRVDLSALLEPARERVELVAVGATLTAAVATADTDSHRPPAPPHGATARVIGTAAAGASARARFRGSGETAAAREAGRGVAGNGFAAYALDGQTLIAEGGAQDGAAKAALGGTIAILRGTGADGERVDGSVGKCFAYGAQRGTLYVQGDADARAAIRLSGADVVFGGRHRGRIRDGEPGLASRANLKGFAFEYMTGGRAIVLGDPGPWICSGMTGGVLYVLLDDDAGMDAAALRRRLAKGAKVALLPPGDDDARSIAELLGGYADALDRSGQPDAAADVRELAARPSRFIAVRAAGDVVDQNVSTE